MYPWFTRTVKKSGLKPRPLIRPASIDRMSVEEIREELRRRGMPKDEAWWLSDERAAKELAKLRVSQKRAAPGKAGK